MKVSVIGSSGGMGSFFVRYFTSKGFDVSGWDLRKAQNRLPGFTSAPSLSSACRGAHVVMLATPIDKTVEVAESVVPHLGRGSCLVEISSVKRSILPRLRKVVARRGISLVSLHPLFGPSLSSFKGMKVAVIRGAGGKIPELAEKLLPDARLVPVGEQEHERMMGLILSMTHLLNLAYAAVLAKQVPVKRFRELATPTSSVQLTLAEGVLSQRPELYSYIQFENGYSSEFADALIRELLALRDIIESRARDRFDREYMELSKQFTDDTSAETMESIYRAFRSSEQT